MTAVYPYLEPQGAVLDLFGGPGGWDVAAAELGMQPIGIEHDASACLTRAAAGHETVRADVSTAVFEHGGLSIEDHHAQRYHHWPSDAIEGLIGSPPCPTFSSAGNRAGILELPYLIQHVHRCITGWEPYVPPADFGITTEPQPDWTCPLCGWWSAKPGRDAPDHVDCEGVDLRPDVTVPILPDPRSALVLEPLRFALGCTPTWIALEQVPDVLPVWEAYAYTLRALGWSVWCGILNSADYGVPQTRRRAILMAHRGKEVLPPGPSHCEGGALTMFGELAPWVSMADALGWDGFDARYQRGAGLTERHGERPDRGCEAPAPTLTGSALGAGAGAKLKLVVRGNNTIAGGPLAERSIDEPAMTVGTRADLWTLHTNRDQRDDGTRQTRECSAPAPALSAKAGGQWAFERPATTVQGDPRLAPPGHRDREGGEPQFGPDALKLTVADALKLQSFPADYPVRGTKTKQFEQIGNAIPPLLARHVLSALSGYMRANTKQGDSV